MLYLFALLKYFLPQDAVGLELWSMSDNILFDNILVTDNVAEAYQFAQETFDLKVMKIEKGQVCCVQGRHGLTLIFLCEITYVLQRLNECESIIFFPSISFFFFFFYRPLIYNVFKLYFR